MKISIFSIVVLLNLIGCSLSVKDKAIVSANEIHEIAVSEAQIINHYCIPKYKSAITRSDIDVVDKVCLPARKSYYAVKFSWEFLIAIIKNSQSVDSQRIEETVLDLSNSLNSLKQLTKEMK